MKQSKNTAVNPKTGKDANKKSRSQRSLAFALLVLLLAAGIFFAVSDIPWIAEYRELVLSELGLGDGGNEEPEPEIIEEPENGQNNGSDNNGSGGRTGSIASLDPGALPEFNGSNYVTVNGNVPVFSPEVYSEAGLVKSGDRWKTDGTIRGVDSNKLNPYEHYLELDSLGRCRGAYGCLGLETMPPDGDDRGDISSVHPSGWAKAQNWERCHLIAWALSDEDANKKNLITGTHYLNYDGMRPLEEEVEHYIWNTGNHVLYASIPIFVGKELVARGVQMQAWSVEDEGEGISFNVYCFNVTPGAEIDYFSGIVTTAEQAAQDARLYIVNTRSKVFHYPTCEGAQSMSAHNRKEVNATRSELVAQGYIPCGACEP